MDEQHDQARASDRRKFLAGAAGLAAGAAVLGTASPASAAAPSTGEHDLDLVYIDMSNGNTTSVGLGTGGLAKGFFATMGDDMAVLSLRVKLGSSPTPGDGPWGLVGANLPAGFQPVVGPSDITEIGTASFLGTGLALSFNTPNLNNYTLGLGLSNFGGAMMFSFSMLDRPNDGSGSVMFNYGGTVPFGHPLAEGDIVYGQIVYQRDTSGD